MAADWSCLPVDLVRQIANRLSAVEDFSGLMAVCRSYRSALDDDKKQWRPYGCSLPPPWLLLCCQDDDGDGGGEIPPRGILSMYRNKKFFMDLPELHGRHCWGSPYGWIVTLGLDQQLHMFNPVSRRRILLPLPPVTCDQDFGEDESAKSRWIRKLLVKKAILIPREPGSYSSTGFDEFLVVAINGYGLLTVMRPRTNAWETMEKLYMSSDNVGKAGLIHEVVSYNGEVYAVGVHGRVLICSNLDGPGPPTAQVYAPHDYDIGGWHKLYLLESLGELLLVVRYLRHQEDEAPTDEDEAPTPTDEGWYKTNGFDVFKLNHKNKEWIQVDDLGDRALFVGDCQTIALSPAKDFNCRGNCIYFNDDNYEQFYFHDDNYEKFSNKIGGHDMGVFDYTDGKIQRFFEGADSLSSYSTPVWFIPTFN